MGEKQTLILVPGLLCDAALWQNQIIDLLDVCDVSVADITWGDSMEVLAQGVLDEAPDEFALAGLSMGGYVVQEIMRQAPERVTHVAFVDTNARADTPEQTLNRQRMIKIAEEGRFESIAPEMLPNLVHPDHVDDPKSGQVFLTMAANVGSEAFIDQQTAIMNRVDGRADLGKIACPTLVLCGEQDALTPVKVHQEIVDGVGDHAKLVVVPDCGHLSPLEQPEAVTDAFRAWLAE
ncbi:MAG: alpha/beta hydrolase [Magnetovibrio sp.]|nr:alpha/beta hydrolase [Magnetovibrio sp.]